MNLIASTATEVPLLVLCGYPVYLSDQGRLATVADLEISHSSLKLSAEASQLTLNDNPYAPPEPLPSLVGKAWEESSLSGQPAPVLSVPSAVLQGVLQGDVYTPSVRARLFPNGEFSLGFVPPPSKLKSERMYDAGIVDDYVSVTTAYAVVTEGGDIFFDVTVPEATYLYKLDRCQESSQPKKLYGQDGITGYGRKCVRNLCFLMERDLGCSRLNFGTCTVPRLTARQEAIVCEKWGEIVRYFFQCLRRRYRSRCEGDFRYVAVTEIQPKRWAVRGEVGLHLHFLYEKIYDSFAGEHVFHDNFIRSSWHSALSSVLGRFSSSEFDDPSLSVPMFRRESVTGGVDRYLSKYMSKGGEVLREVREKKPTLVLPSQWWSTDSVSRSVLKSETIELSGDLSSLVLDSIVCGHPGAVVYANAVEIPYHGCPRIVGYAGCLTPSFADYLRSCIPAPPTPVL